MLDTAVLAEADGVTTCGEADQIIVLDTLEPEVQGRDVDQVGTLARTAFPEVELCFHEKRMASVFNTLASVESNKHHWVDQLGLSHISADEFVVSIENATDALRSGALIGNEKSSFPKKRKIVVKLAFKSCIVITERATSAKRGFQLDSQVAVNNDDTLADSHQAAIADDHAQHHTHQGSSMRSQPFHAFGAFGAVEPYRASSISGPSLEVESSGIEEKLEYTVPLESSHMSGSIISEVQTPYF